MSQAQRDAAYNNTAAVADSAEWVSRWTEVSAKRRGIDNAILDVSYGPKERNKIDLFPGDQRAPTLAYIHGGYWQRGAREWYACMGEGVAAHGWSSAIMGYTLAPDARISQIVTEIIASLEWITNKADAYGLGRPLIIAGWSAGAHLTAFGLQVPGVEAGLAISGIYELGPIRDTYLDEKLQLSDMEIEQLSPLRLLPVGKPLAVAYGTRELPRLIEDSRALHAMRSAHHLLGTLLPLPGCNHFDALDELRKPNGHLTRAAVETCGLITPSR